MATVAAVPVAAGPVDVPVRPSAYMDDLIIMLSASSPRELLRQLILAAQLMVQTSTGFGFSVNFAAGKTEAVVHLVGATAAEERRRLWAGVAQGQVPELDLGNGLRLRLVQQYKHLGCVLASSRSFERELTHRIAAGKVAAGSLGRHLFANRHLPDTAVGCAAAACVASRVLFGAELWPRLSPKQAQRTEAALLQPLRRAATCTQTRGLPCVHLSLEEVRRRYGIPALQVRLDAAKLRCAARLSRQASPELRALVLGPGGLAWRQELAAAILVMQRVLAPKLDSLPDPRSTGGLAAWEALWASQPGAWQTYIRQLLRVAVDAPGSLPQTAPCGTPIPAALTPSPRNGFACPARGSSAARRPSTCT